MTHSAALQAGFGTSDWKKQLPTLPAVVMKLNDLLADARVGQAEVAEVLASDPVLTAKVLRLVNSSYYGVPGGVSDIQKALAFLGFETVSQVVLSVGVLSAFPVESSEEFSFEGFWIHSFGVAILAQDLSKKRGDQKSAPAFTAGLLHDIGKLVLHEINPKAFFQVVKEARDQAQSFLGAETKLSLPGHTELGAAMIQEWGIPGEVADCVLHHHDVEDASSLVTKTVSLANDLMRFFQVGQSGDFSLSKEEWATRFRDLSIPFEDSKKGLQSMRSIAEKAEELYRAYR